MMSFVLVGSEIIEYTFALPAGFYSLLGLVILNVELVHSSRLLFLGFVLILQAWPF